MNLISERKIGATENDKFTYGIYQIEGFEKEKILLLIKAMCINMGPEVEIKIRFTSDDAERVEPLIFNSYNDFLCGLSSFVFTNVDFVSMYNGKIMTSINLLRSTLTVSTENPELEEQFSSNVSTSLFEFR